MKELVHWINLDVHEDQLIGVGKWFDRHVVFVSDGRQQQGHEAIGQAAAEHECRRDDAEEATRLGVRQHDFTMFGQYYILPILGDAVDARPDRVTMEQ